MKKTNNKTVKNSAQTKMKRIVLINRDICETIQILDKYRLELLDILPDQDSGFVLGKEQINEAASFFARIEEQKRNLLIVRRQLDIVSDNIKKSLKRSLSTKESKINQNFLNDVTKNMTSLSTSVKILFIDVDDFLIDFLDDIKSMEENEFDGEMEDGFGKVG